MTLPVVSILIPRQSNVLNLSYAQLELDYKHIRAVTPFYSIYDITPGRDWAKVTSDKSPAAVAIRGAWTSKASVYQV